jgi:hypothetical protein
MADVHGKVPGSLGSSALLHRNTANHSVPTNKAESASRVLTAFSSAMKPTMPTSLARATLGLDAVPFCRGISVFSIELSYGC